jgi:hypothetical protein
MTQKKGGTNSLDAIMDGYYRNGKRRMTKEEAIQIIRENRERYLFKPGLSWGERHRKQRVYARGLSWDLIQIIRKSPDDDPIRIIKEFQFMMEDVMLESNNEERVLDFCRITIEAVDDILEILE